MGNVQHTPGPWAVFNGTDVFPVDDFDGMNHIASTDPNGNHPVSGVRRTSAEQRAELEADPASKSHIPYSEAQANARLIAAAPEMLEALKGIQAEAIANEAGNPGYPSPWAAVLAAIAKATGQTPDGAK